jgi:opacity protein-like surface antigen
MRIQGTAGVAVLLTLLLGPPAGAGDWTGFYLGGHTGAFSGTTTFSDPDGPSLYGGNSVASPGFLAGIQLGYNRQLAPQWMLGAEADASWLSSSGSNTCLQSSVTTTGSNCKVTPRAIATLTGRLGFVTEPRGRTLLYGKAGVAWMRADYSMNPNNVPLPGPYGADPANDVPGINLSEPPNQADPTSGSLSAWGPTVGAGVEYAFSPRWSLKMEYDYLHFNGLSLPTPEVTNVATNGSVTNLGSSGSSNITQNLHAVKVGLNYRWGVESKASGADGSAAYGSTGPDAAPFVAGWEFDAGARFWYSWGKFQTGNGRPNELVSRLTYSGVTGQSGELFARVDTPIDIFFKGFIGGGGLSRGRMYDEDWGLAPAAVPVPNSYEVTQSDVTGTLHYFTADIGYNFMRGPDHKVGLFAGYNRYETTMSSMGCLQLVQPASGVCASPNFPLSTTLIDETDTWQSLRLGVSAEARLWERVKIGADLAWLPYVKYDGLDNHVARAVLFPVQGTGQGVQAELLLSYLVTDAFCIGVGGRYWAMWTNTASQTDLPTNIFQVETERYGVFVQASYKFRAPR